MRKLNDGGHIIPHRFKFQIQTQFYKMFWQYSLLLRQWLALQNSDFLA